MVNDLVRSWFPRAKYVDDLTVLEIVPRNSPPVMPFLVNEINDFACKNNMVLNPKKCKCMPIDPLEYNSCVWSPVVIGSTVVERISVFKLLGITISYDLSWDKHVDIIVKKANKRMYALRQLKRSGVCPEDLVCIYCTLIRSVIEYGAVVFSNLPIHLSKAIERVQKRALSIINPGLPYDLALRKFNLPSLQERRVFLCKRYMERVGDPVSSLVRSRTINNTHTYDLRSTSHQRQQVTRTKRLHDFVSVKYL